MKGLMKVCSGGSAMWWRGWKGIRLPTVYVSACAGSRSASRPWKRWIDTIKKCLRKRSLEVRQARRMVQDRSEWYGFVRGNALGIALGMTPDLDGIPQLRG